MWVYTFFSLEDIADHIYFFFLEIVIEHYDVVISDNSWISWNKQSNSVFNKLQCNLFLKKKKNKKKETG